MVGDQLRERRRQRPDRRRTPADPRSTRACRGRPRRSDPRRRRGRGQRQAAPRRARSQPRPAQLRGRRRARSTSRSRHRTTSGSVERADVLDPLGDGGGIAIAPDRLGGLRRRLDGRLASCHAISRASASEVVIRTATPGSTKPRFTAPRTRRQSPVEEPQQRALVRLRDRERGARVVGRQGRVPARGGSRPARRASAVPPATSLHMAGERVGGERRAVEHGRLPRRASGSRTAPRAAARPPRRATRRRAGLPRALERGDDRSNRLGRRPALRWRPRRRAAPRPARDRSRCTDGVRREDRRSAGAGDRGLDPLDAPAERPTRPAAAGAVRRSAGDSSTLGPRLAQLDQSLDQRRAATARRLRPGSTSASSYRPTSSIAAARSARIAGPRRLLPDGVARIGEPRLVRRPQALDERLLVGLRVVDQRRELVEAALAKAGVDDVERRALLAHEQDALARARRSRRRGW